MKKEQFSVEQIVAVGPFYRKRFTHAADRILGGAGTTGGTLHNYWFLSQPACWEI